jgi:hypothetical protein
MSTGQRHPSAWRPDLKWLAERLAAELRSRDSPCPDIGAAALVARGVTGRNRDEWAAVHGIDRHRLDAVETGRVPLGALPPGLRRAMRDAGVTPRPYRGRDERSDMEITIPTEHEDR